MLEELGPLQLREIRSVLLQREAFYVSNAISMALNKLKRQGYVELTPRGWALRMYT